MKSIKPGRGPSMMGGIVGIVMIGFGIVWTVITAKIGGVFAIFGVLWTLIAVIITAYNFKNATSKNRYSEFDIVDGTEEPDPLNQRFSGGEIPQKQEKRTGGGFCPYCGVKAEAEYQFCRSCGKELP